MPPAPVTKVDAVRAALDAGITTPKEIVFYIQERFGITTTASMVSCYKSVLKKRRFLPPESSTALARPQFPVRRSRADQDLEMLVRGLFDTYGIDAVREMVERLEAQP